MKQGGTTESQVKGEIHKGMTNNEKRRSPEFPEIGNIGVPEFSGNGKHRKFRSFRKSNNKWINIPRKLTGVPGCVRTVGTDSNICPQWEPILHRINPWRKSRQVHLQQLDVHWGWRVIYPVDTLWVNCGFWNNSPSPYPVGKWWALSKVPTHLPSPNPAGKKWALLKSTH